MSVVTVFPASKRLKDAMLRAGVDIGPMPVNEAYDALADRIEELERTLGLADDQRREWEHHCKAAEAKLAKAVATLEYIAKRRGLYSAKKNPRRTERRDR